MSSRPIEVKKRRRVAKKLRRESPTAFFDLWQWLIDHGYARTRKEAREVILAERVRSNSHTLGITQQPVIERTGDGFEVNTKNVALRYVNKAHLSDLIVLDAS